MLERIDRGPPRLARGLGEFYLPTIPFFNEFMARVGSVVGTPENCRQLFERGECVLVFPEGARGFVKPYSKAYRLQRFGLGFMRLALEHHVPILPVGVVGGIYGVGGGALLAPVAVAVVHMPARAIAGPALFGTLATSVAGIAVFGLFHGVTPDWTLGLLFGAGGLLGAYCGARLQKHLPERWLKLVLALLLTALGISYCARLLASLTAWGR